MPNVCGDFPPLLFCVEKRRKKNERKMFSSFLFFSSLNLKPLLRSEKKGPKDDHVFFLSFSTLHDLRLSVSTTTVAVASSSSSAGSERLLNVGMRIRKREGIWAYQNDG